jgi:hypothetical protein
VIQQEQNSKDAILYNRKFSKNRTTGRQHEENDRWTKTRTLDVSKTGYQMHQEKNRITSWNIGEYSTLMLEQICNYVNITEKSSKKIKRKHQGSEKKAAKK